MNELKFYEGRGILKTEKTGKNGDYIEGMETVLNGNCHE